MLPTIMFTYKSCLPRIRKKLKKKKTRVLAFSKNVVFLFLFLLLNACSRTRVFCTGFSKQVCLCRKSYVLKCRYTTTKLHTNVQAC